MLKIFLVLALLLSAVVNRASAETSPLLTLLFAQWIKESPKTLQGVLKDLPQSHFKNFTLMSDSRSLHESSVESPRVILFGDTGETIFTFNGDSNHNGYANLEIADFDPINKTLNLYEVRFKKENSELNQYEFSPLTADEIYAETENIRISKANPAKCMACHQAEFKSSTQNIKFATYIWDSYNKWPGAYAASDDRIQQSTDPNYPSEEVKFLAFKKNAQSNKDSRYHPLVFGNEHSLSPYQDPKKRQLKYMPNTKLTLLVAANYSRMISHFIMKDTNPTAVKEWLCDYSSNYVFPKSLKIGGSTKNLPSGRWNTGLYDILGFGQDLFNLVQSHTAQLAWKVDISSIVEAAYPFYELSQDQTNFLVYSGLYFLGVDDSRTGKVFQSLRDKNCQ